MNHSHFNAIKLIYELVHPLMATYKTKSTPTKYSFQQDLFITGCKWNVISMSYGISILNNLWFSWHQRVCSTSKAIRVRHVTCLHFHQRSYINQIWLWPKMSPFLIYIDHAVNEDGPSTNCMKFHSSPSRRLKKIVSFIEIVLVWDHIMI